MTFFFNSFYYKCIIKVRNITFIRLDFRWDEQSSAKNISIM